jgi:hypothetical protein
MNCRADDLIKDEVKAIILVAKKLGGYQKLSFSQPQILTN